MGEPNGELAKATSEVLEWLGATPETAGALLGINGRTLSAMTQGIVPMRSLIIRFAGAVGKHCDTRPGAQEWWADADRWLDIAGYSARRDVVGRRPGGPPLPEAPPERRFGPPRAATAAEPPSETPAEVPENAPPAGEHYRPVYERKTWGDSHVHVFWIVDPDERKVFQMTMPASVDYKARAGQVKRDLQSLSRLQFERKYGRHRVNEVQ
jgi:hypothetical protein